MPFHNSVYYPYQSEPPGGQSSAGIPSLLNSPQSQRSSSSGLAPGAPAMSGAPPVPVFKFRPRRESVDWRRISAVDVDRVAGELDFQTLQEHVMGVTFCSVEHERCPHCQNPVDPVLLKLFRLAQLTVEYLLHSQDYLTHSLQAAEEKLQAAALEKEQLHAQLQKQAQDAKGLKDELKQRKKIIVSQQSMINAGMGGYHKCQCCDKAFMNSSFLQSHMQRRHPEEYDIRLMSEKQRKVQAVKLQEEINKLKEQLSLTRSQLEVQQQAHTLKASQSSGFAAVASVALGETTSRAPSFLPAAHLDAPNLQAPDSFPRDSSWCAQHSEAEPEGSSGAVRAEQILIISGIITVSASVEQCIRVLWPWPEAMGRQAEPRSFPRAAVGGASVVD